MGCAPPTLGDAGCPAAHVGAAYLLPVLLVHATIVFSIDSGGHPLLPPYSPVTVHPLFLQEKLIGLALCV